MFASVCIASAESIFVYLSIALTIDLSTTARTPIPITVEEDVAPTFLFVSLLRSPRI